MRRALALVLLVLLCGGCITPEVKTIVHRNADLQEHFLAAMVAGQASDADIRQNVQVNAKAWRELDDLLQGKALPVEVTTQ